ncbi:MAG: response regulator transcription factor [Actinomycetota bacterium]|nr:response regulator transcription factor [Actinomycetota bacterium]MDA8366827.1 response regulator transcription factor [Actinomycetota bacterium]
MTVSDDHQSAHDHTITVGIVDDHALVRAGLRELVESEPRLRVVGEADDTESAIDMLASLRPHVALVDLELPGGGGIAVLEAAAARVPETRCLVVSAYSDYAYIAAALDASAAGYLLKTANRTELAEAIVAVSKGTTVLDREVAQRLQRRWRDEREPEVSLTPREVEVLSLIARGAANKEIAAELGLGIRTVEGYVSNVLAKLGASSRTEAALWAHEHRIVGGGPGPLSPNRP